MNPKRIVRLSNILGLISILALIYWVFIFVLIEVFGLKVFRENITQTFYMSILGILALMFGSLMINIMFNMTRIAEKHNADAETVSGFKKVPILIFAISFPVIAILLYTGDWMTKIKKEKLLVDSAKTVLQINEASMHYLAEYQFDRTWITQSAEILTFLKNYDNSFGNIYLIVRDQIELSPIYLKFSSWDKIASDSKIEAKKYSYIFSTDQAQREYLAKVFNQETSAPRFTAHDGSYELFYPFTSGKQTIVLYFTDQQDYGKIGS